MLEKLKTKKHESIKAVNDAIYFNDLFLIRTLEKLTALSSNDYSLVWEIDIKGKTLINLKNIYIIKDIIIVFSYYREEDLYYIHGIDKEGNLLWNISSTHQPNGNHAVCIRNNKLLYNGYSSSFTNTLIIEIDPIKGTLTQLADLKTNASYLSNINGKLLLSGSSGFCLLNDEHSLEPVNNDFIVSIIDSNENKITYLSETDKIDLYNVVVLDKNLATEVIGEIYLDNSDKGNMLPLLQGNKLISFKGQDKGVACTDLANGNEIWHIGDKEISGISVKMLDEKNFALLLIDFDLNRSLNIYNIETGELVRETDFKGISSKIFYLNNTLIVGSSRGMHIYDLSKN